VEKASGKRKPDRIQCPTLSANELEEANEKEKKNSSFSFSDPARRPFASCQCVGQWHLRRLIIISRHELKMIGAQTSKFKQKTLGRWFLSVPLILSIQLYWYWHAQSWSRSDQRSEMFFPFS